MVTSRSSVDCPPCPKRLVVELLALDLATCRRCTGTGANLMAALDTAADALRSSGTEVDVRQVVVKTAEQAERLRFASSPTVRVNGRDIAMELRESACGDCGELCGCEGGVDCRVWVWQGEEHLEAPKEMISHALIAACGRADSAAAASNEPFVLPENLRKYFDARALKEKGASAECCDKTACCEPAAKPACRGAAPSPAACGCQ